MQASQEQLAKFDAEHGGMVAVHLITGDEFAAALLRASLGDREAALLARACETIIRAPRQLCMLCERKTPRALGMMAVLLPYGKAEPESAIGFTFCRAHEKMGKDRLMELSAKKLYPQGSSVRRVTDIGPPHPTRQ